MPKVSIIIPVYNSARTIIRTLESVRKQTFDDWEVLVIDNGSDDETVEKVKEYSQGETRIKLFFSDRGRSIARNYGIKKASGKYILFLDADDEIASEMLIKTTDFLDNHSLYSAVATSCIIKNDLNHKCKKKEVYYPFRHCLYVLNPFRINSVVLRNSALVDFNVHLQICEDWLFWVENLVNKEVKLLPDIYGSIVHVTGKNSSTNYTKMLYYQLLVRKIIKEKYPFGSLNLFIKDLKTLIVGEYYHVIPDGLEKAPYFYGCCKIVKLLLKTPAVKKKLVCYARKKEEEYIY